MQITHNVQINTMQITDYVHNIFNKSNYFSVSSLEIIKNVISVSNKTAISFRDIRVVVRKLLSHDTAVP